jgi:hypothetical protein
MKKLKDLLKESYVWERNFGEKLLTLADVQKKKNEEKLSEKVMKIKYYKTVSKEEWNKTHKNYKSVIDGVKYLMVLDPKRGTILAPVIVK